MALKLKRNNVYTRLVKSADYKSTMKDGKRLHSDFFMCFVKCGDKIIKKNLCNDSDPIQNIGIIASKKVGGAIQRNRCKRLIREICFNYFKNVDDLDAKGTNITYTHRAMVIVAKKELLYASFCDIQKAFANCINKYNYHNKTHDFYNPKQITHNQKNANIRQLRIRTTKYVYAA